MEDKAFTWDEIKRHNRAQDLWLVIDGSVYDVSNFTGHPGSYDLLVQNGGSDATLGFTASGHSE
jgi:cytochrome b involved in lipid metabolism